MIFPKSTLDQVITVAFWISVIVLLIVLFEMRKEPGGETCFLLAGADSINPVLFTLAVGLILAWKVAGYYGLDRYLLPLLGTPWHPGTITGSEKSPRPA